MKTFKAKSSVGRWAKKNIGENWKELGTVEQNDEGWYFKENEVEKVIEAAANEVADCIARVEKAQEVETELDDDIDVVKVSLKGKSKIGSPCRVVWDIAEKMAGAKRKDIIAACVEAGIAFYTARTQYQKYTEALKEANA